MQKTKKNEIFGSYNIDYLLTQDFSKSFSKLSPIEFVRDILVKKLNVKHIVTGYDHHFGKNRNANSNQLIEFSKDFGFDVTKVDAFQKNEVSISSTKIRNLIINGKINEANQLLGYQFILTGKVIGGLGRGKSLGFPTANILIDNYKIKPANGVYYINSICEYNQTINIYGSEILLDCNGQIPYPTYTGANMIVGVDMNNKKESCGKKFGMTHFVNPSEIDGDLVNYLVDLTGGGADYSFECILSLIHI